MLDHVSLGVKDLKRSQEFYDRALKPLGLARVYDVPGGAGCGGSKDKPVFLIGAPIDPGRPVAAGGGTHVAFTAPNRKAVDEFHKAAVAAGAKDDGKPGPRPIYHANYYGAFVLDPDGHKVEACCHRP